MAAPHITTPTPAVGPLAADESLVFRVYENGTALVRTGVAVAFAGMALTEVVWDGAAFTPGYTGRSTRTAVTDMTYGNGHEYRVRRAPVWPDAPRLGVWAINTAGQQTTLDAGPWTVDAPAPTEPAPVIPVFPAAVGAGPADSDAVQFDQAHFLDTLEAVLAPEWLRPLIDNAASGSGYELLQAAAKVAARVSQACARLEVDSFEATAPGPAKARGTVEFLRATDDAGALRVLAGSVVKTSTHGRRFVTLEDAVFGASDLGPVGVAAEAVDYGYQYNVKGRVVTPSGVTLPGDIDTIERMFQADAAGVPDFIDGTITVQQIVDFAGGVDPALDGLGQDRGLPRGDGEPDDVYRARIMGLPDTLTPNAIRRGLDMLAAARGVTYQYIETNDPRYQTCWDFPSPNAGTPTYLPDFPAELTDLSNVFTYDDPRPVSDGFMNRWLDSVEARGAFIVVVNAPLPIAEYGAHYDSADVMKADRETLNGTVSGFFAISAYDVRPAELNAGGWGVVGCYDGFDAGLSGFWRAWWDTIQKLKAAGVAAILERAGE